MNDLTALEAATIIETLKKVHQGGTYCNSCTRAMPCPSLQAADRLEAAERALVTAREALEKYANEDNYTASWEPIDSGGAALTRGFEEDEPWAVAQQALTDIAAVLGTEER